MASVELPAQQVRAELKARGIDDVVAGRGGVAAVHGDRRRDPDGPRSRRGLGGAGRDGPRGGRRCRVALTSGRSDPRGPGRRLAELTPRHRSALLLGHPYDPRSSPLRSGMGRTTCVSMVRFAAAVQAALEDGYRVFAELSPHPLLTRAVEQTAPVSDTPVAALAACGATKPLRTAARLRLRSVQCRRGGGLLGALPGRATGGRAAADVDAPTAASRPQRRFAGTGAHTCRSPPLAGRACATAGGTSGTPGRLTSAPPSCRGCTTGYTTWLRFRGRPTARWLSPPPKACSRTARRCARRVRRPAAARRPHRGRCGRIDRGARCCDVRHPDRSGRGAGPPGGGEPALGRPDRRRPSAISGLLAAHPDVTTGEEIRDSLAARGIEFGPAFTV